MKKAILVLALILGSKDATWAQPRDFKISEIFPVDESHSYVGFAVKYMGYAMVRGRFNNFRGTIRYSPDLTKVSVTFRIDVNSIDTGNEWRDTDLRSDNWFGGNSYPTIRFISRQSSIIDGVLLVTGDLTIRNITRSITIPMTYTSRVLNDIREDSQIIFSGEIKLNRVEFGIEGKNWAGIKEGITAVSDDVNIELTILGKRINAPNFKYWVANESTPHGKIYSIAKKEGVAKALVEFESMRLLPNNKLDVETLNTVGLMLLKENNVKDATAIFRKNILCFPLLPVVYESYAEAEATQGNWTEAIKYYKLALEKDPDNVNAYEILRHIQD